MSEVTKDTAVSDLADDVASTLAVFDECKDSRSAAKKHHVSVTNPTLLKESKKLVELVSVDDWHHLTDTQIRFDIRVTLWRGISFKAQIREDYPNTAIIAELWPSDKMSVKLVSKLGKKVKKMIEKNAVKQQAQIEPLCEFLYSVMHSNVLCCAWEEVSEIQSRYASIDSLSSSSTSSQSRITVKVNETKGTLKFVMEEGDYKTTIILTIPEQYPLHPVKLKFGKDCTFPDRFLQLYQSQSENIASKLSLGYDLEYAFERKVRVITEEDRNEMQKQELDVSAVHSIRSDMKVMHKVSEFENELKHKSAKVRRKLKKLTKQAIDEEKEMNEQRDLKLKRLLFDEVGTRVNDPNPSLLPVTNYLIESFRTLPSVMCVFCNKRVIPKKSEDLVRMEMDSAKRKRISSKSLLPQRLKCGDWCHHKCLDKFIMEPPWDKICPKCGSEVKHKLFPQSKEVLERQYAVMQAKKRELEEAEGFVDDLFF